jgi:hypothetical protein
MDGLVGKPSLTGLWKGSRATSMTLAKSRKASKSATMEIVSF